MFFNIKNDQHLNSEQLKTDVFLNAYFIIKNYPLRASEKLLDQYIQQHYNTNLKNLCIKIILNLTFHKDDLGKLTLVFRDLTYDQLARLITYGNGTIPGSRILQIALS